MCGTILITRLQNVIYYHGNQKMYIIFNIRQPDSGSRDGSVRLSRSAIVVYRHVPAVL